MKFSRYCMDRWLSIFIFFSILAAGGGLLQLVETPFPVACVVEGFYAAGFFLILLQNYLARKEFYNQLLDAGSSLEEISYFSELLSEPSFQEGQILYWLLKKSEKCRNDKIAGYQQELEEYKEYVELWVHEIKTPIAVSKLITENHRDDVSKSLSEEIDKVEGFVEQMLYYSKSSSLQDDYRIRPVSLKNLVMGSVKKHAKAMVAEKVTPRFENLDEIILTDTKWMDFVLGQIISNGVKYHSRERKPELIFSAVKKEKTVILSISDNGIGIPSEDLGKVFRRGFTGSNGRVYSKATGMGLYLCESLCRKLGTELSISSEEGEGTSVSLTFALQKEDS